MNGLFLTADELDVLSRCSGVAVKAYLRMRARMDLDSGVVGLRSGLSYQALREWTEEAVEKGAGEQVLQPSMRNVRTAVDQLVRRGLLQRLRTEGLVFKCVLAQLAQVRANRTRHEPDRAKLAEPDTEPDTNPTGMEFNIGAGFGVISSSEHVTEPDTNPTGQNSPNPTNIRDQRKASTPQAASTAESGVEVESAVAAMWSAAKAGQGGEPATDTESARRATAIVVRLRKEHGVMATAGNPTVLAWVAQGVRDEAIDAAVALAKRGREDEGSLQPINCGYINAKLQTVLRPPKRTADAWWSSVAAMEAKARELGIAGARPGEELDAFKARIAAAVRREEGAAA